MRLDDKMFEEISTAREIKMPTVRQKEIWNNIEREMQTMIPIRSKRRMPTMLTNIAAAVAGIAVVGCIGYGIHQQSVTPSHTSHVATATSNTVSKVSNKPYSPPKVTFTNGASSVKKFAKFHVVVPEIPQGYSMQMKLLQTTGDVPQQVWFTLSNGNEEKDIKVQEYPRPNPTWSMPSMDAPQFLKTINVDETSVTMEIPAGKTKSYTGYQFTSNGMCYRIESPISLAKQVIGSLVQNPKYLN
ncbi:hypothetical protein [Alicyclobacillus fodiniaquatilis]|uniref:DUF4367 domain-containing protein n=1 Tax=Alicyclobacillus fodiniaquatilis TaxID=1661150 RepID=A0ABW4JJB4_9BACL